MTDEKNQKCWPDINNVGSQEIYRREKPGEPSTVGRHLLIGREEGEDKAQVSGHEGAIVHDKKRHHENVPDIGDDHHLEDVIKTDNSALQPKAEYDGEKAPVIEQDSNQRHQICHDQCNGGRGSYCLKVGEL